MIRDELVHNSIVFDGFQWERLHVRRDHGVTGVGFSEMVQKCGQLRLKPGSGCAFSTVHGVRHSVKSH